MKSLSRVYKVNHSFSFENIIETIENNHLKIQNQYYPCASCKPCVNINLTRAFHLVSLRVSLPGVKPKTRGAERK